MSSSLLLKQLTYLQFKDIHCIFVKFKYNIQITQDAKLEGLGLALDGLRTKMRCAGIIVPLVPEEENAAFARAVTANANHYKDTLIPKLW